ncbi:MAG: hypothetical protein H7Y07_16220 [Pyrinomonadaceae bacterium]|nr:hypothetical protein [Sphingobacteriaceae bacterium]
MPKYIKTSMPAAYVKWFLSIGLQNRFDGSVSLKRSLYRDKVTDNLLIAGTG